MTTTRITLEQWIEGQYRHALNACHGDASAALQQLIGLIKTKAAEHNFLITEEFQKQVADIVEAVNAELNKPIEAPQPPIQQPTQPTPEAVPDIEFAQKTAPPAPALPPPPDAGDIVVSEPAETELDLFSQPVNPHGKHDPYREQGEAIAKLMARIPGVNTTFEWIGVDASSRYVVHKIRDIDNGEGNIFDPNVLTSKGSILKYRGFVPPGMDASIVVRPGYVAIELPKIDWQPVFLKTVLDKTPKATWEDPFRMWLGVNSRGETIELDLSHPSGAHTLVGGSTGGGKTNVFHTAIPGSIMRYTHLSGFVQFILVDVSGISFQFYDDFSPWFWDGRGVIDSREEIEDIFKIGADEEMGEGALWDEVRRRAKWFRIARVDNIRDYNRKALRSNGELPFMSRLVVAFEEMSLTNDLFHPKESPTTFKLWIRKIAKELRKYGIHLFLADQDPKGDWDGAFDMDTLKQIGNRICLSTNGDEDVSRRVLGKRHKLGAYLTNCGDSYVIRPGWTEPERVQIYFTPGELVEKLGASARKNRSQLIVLHGGRLDDPEELEAEAETDELLSLVGETDPDWEAWQRVQKAIEDYKKENPDAKKIPDRPLLIAAFGHEYNPKSRAADGARKQTKPRLDALFKKFGGQENVA